jgi:starch-binding outer membrane protein SusE/F
MKPDLKYLFAALLLLSSFMACKKESNVFFANGKAPVLSSSVKTIAASTSDSLMSVMTLTWTNPDYATDPSTVQYVIQIDSAGRNFSKAVSFTVTGVLNDSFSAKQINTVALGFGFSFGVAYNMDVRLISSYSNNNEQLTSNTLTLQVTPYKIPPKVTPPPSNALYIIGGATAGGWNQPVPAVTQQFTQIDSVTYQGTFYLSGGGAYDFLPVNGSWNVKYNVASNAVAGLAAGGAFEYSTGPGQDIPGPAKSGLYTIKVDFQGGTFTVTPVDVYAFLYVPGAYQGWSPATAPTLASVTANGQYQGYVNITATGGFKFASEADWNGTNYGDTAVAGESGVLTSAGGYNLGVPATGYYYLQANITANTWSSTAVTWSLIGDFNNWSADAPMTYNATSQVWTGTINASAAGGFKFRANDSWNLSYGTGGPGNSLTSNSGGNVPITAGNHNITLDLHIPGYYTYSIQ